MATASAVSCILCTRSREDRALKKQLLSRKPSSSLKGVCIRGALEHKGHFGFLPLRAECPSQQPETPESQPGYLLAMGLRLGTSPRLVASAMRVENPHLPGLGRACGSRMHGPGGTGCGMGSSVHTGCCGHLVKARWVSLEPGSRYSRSFQV